MVQRSALHLCGSFSIHSAWRANHPRFLGNLENENGGYTAFLSQPLVRQHIICCSNGLGVLQFRNIVLLLIPNKSLPLLQEVLAPPASQAVVASHPQPGLFLAVESLSTTSIIKKKHQIYCLQTRLLQYTWVSYHDTHTYVWL
jgi:hypothetical protein